MRTLPTSPTLGQPASPSGPRRSTTAPRWAAAAIMDSPATAGILSTVWSGDPAVVVPSPPGSGKTRLVSLLAATLATRAGLRVAAAAQTRDQAVEVARRTALLQCPTTLMWSTKGTPPASLHNTAVRVARGREARYPNNGGGVLIATTARWLYADPNSIAADAILVDEAWQQTYADLGALGAFAPQIVCVGDPGQISPVVTGSTRRWADSLTGPHLPAPDALLAAHRESVSVVALPHTWRLGPDTTSLIQPAFYPTLPFTSRRPPENLTTATGTPLPEVVARLVTVHDGPTDPTLLTTTADTARSLIGTTLTTNDGTRPLTAHDVAVVTPHVNQAAAVRALTADLPGILIGTANQLQGMERHAVVALHPLAGYPDPNPFTTDPGRACVMLSRHRTHLTLITDTTTHTALRRADPGPGITQHLTLLDTLLDT